MRRLLLLLIVALPMYGDDSLTLTVFSKLHPHRPTADDPIVAFDPGAMRLNWNKDWRFTFLLPLGAPFRGARLEDGSNIPDPWDLVGGIPYTNTMPPWLNDRSVDVEREYARIQTTTNEGHVTFALTSGGSH